MSEQPFHVDVAIVGGGPVGVYLAAELSRRGVDCVVLERLSRPHRHSRSIGIHPPALAALESIHAHEDIVREAVLVRRGVAYAGGERLGALGFDTVPSPHPYVATLPQDRTEAILEAALERVARGRLLRGHAVQSVVPTRDGVALAGVARAPNGGAGGAFRVAARVVVGCDGRDSVVRSELGLRWRRRRYPDAYVMGDVHDTTDLADVAAIYLEREGVVESFPLPGARRRWVVKTATRVPEITADDFARLLLERAGVRIDPASCSMTSSFGIERGVAERFASGRVLLAGDSAHVLPPIGGQGMNLGWLDAQDLASWLPDALHMASESRWVVAARAYDARRRTACRAAARRAELNVRLGRATRWAPLRGWLVRGLLSRPVAPTMAKMFTMHGLASVQPTAGPGGSQ